MHELDLVFFRQVRNGFDLDHQPSFNQQVCEVFPDEVGSVEDGKRTLLNRRHARKLKLNAQRVFVHLLQKPRAQRVMHGVRTSDHTLRQGVDRLQLA